MGNCEENHGEYCRYGARFEMLEKRIDDLETMQEKEEAFRIAYQSDREERLIRDEKLNAKIDSIDDKIESMSRKIESLMNYKSEQENKPNKLVDGIKEKAVAAVVGAIIAGAIAAVVWMIRSM